MLFINGKFYTEEGFQEAVLIEEGKFKRMGSTKKLLEDYPDSEIIDLNKKLVLPGFNDSHLHLLSFERFFNAINLDQVDSVPEIIKLGKEALNEKEILILYNYDDSLFKDSLICRDLDEISCVIPIIAYRACGHIAVVNSKALEKLPNFNSNLLNRETGTLKEDALGLLEELYPEASVEQLKEKIKKTIKFFNSFGITSIGTNDLKDNLEEGKRIIAAYRELDLEKSLNSRVSLQFSFTEIEKIEEVLKLRIDSSYFRFGPLKLFLDGSLGGKTALLSEPYPDDSYGIQTLATEKLEELLAYSESRNLQVAVHSIGDVATEIFLQAFQKTCFKKLRHFLIHLQVLRKDLISSLEKFKIPASVQPIFIEEDMRIAKKLSPKLQKTSYAFKSLNQATKTSFSSDAPYGGLNPFRGIAAAISQANSHNEELNPDEKMTIIDTILAYTINSAYLTFEEDCKGRIARGFYGDFIVLDQDIFLVPTNEIKNTKVEMTVLGGRVVYKKGEF